MKRQIKSFFIYIRILFRQEKDVEKNKFNQINISFSHDFKINCWCPDKCLRGKLPPGQGQALGQDQGQIQGWGQFSSEATSLGYTFQKHADHVFFYRLETTVLNVPEVTDCVSRQRPPCYIVLQGFSFTFTTMVLSRQGLSSYEKNYGAKTPKLYQIRGGKDFQYSRRAQIQEKKNILVQCYSIFTSSTLYFLTNIPIINERVSISILVSTEKNN